MSCMQFAYGDTLYKVKASDTLDKIVNKFYKSKKFTKHQLYIGILAENPAAFRLGNINYLKRGHTLNIPDATSILAMEPKDATRLVSEHNNAKKVRLPPPFKDYTPKNNPAMSSDIKVITEKQQAASDKLKQLDSESEQLRIKLEQLEADKKAMDEELQTLNNLISE